MKRDNTSRYFPEHREEVEAAIAQAPEKVTDPETPYDPNDPGSVEEFWTKGQVRLPGKRGPGRKPRKVLLSVRYSPEVVEHFKATGEGWQTRMDEALKEWVATHRGPRP